jgi:hypothetical protein
MFKSLVLITISALALWYAVDPGDGYFVDIVAVSTVKAALKPSIVTFSPLAHKRAPDGAFIVAGVATARGRDLASQLRIEKICRASEAACYVPHLVFLGRAPGT